MNKIFARLALAISYVTCVPAANLENSSEEDLSGLSKYLPSVGILIGMALCVIEWTLHGFQSNNVLSAGIVAFAWLWLTGGLHMDGLMDTADGVYSHRSRERMLEIMHDPRVGNFAVLVSITVLALKIFALAGLTSQKTILPVLFVIPAWARLCEAYAIGAFQYARETGKGKIWHDTTRFPRDFVLALIPVMVASILCGCFNSKATFVAAASTIASGIFAAHWLNNKVGGHTGDTYGAVIEAAECAGVVITALFAS
jgi:adenosylcobinamide-GDP ribazoletransferase